MNISQINSAIIQGSFTNDQLTSIIDAVKYNRAQLGKQIKRSFVVGSRVKFTSSRSGMVMTGVVRKISIKNVIVDTIGSGNHSYTVPANMLEAA
jgi:hypothetical protein